ncbi:hypothetical protein PF005_g19196 [Phytophthora fragariae]|uniref:Helitron helicase-like domain-containing protein n=1 Tax=Phytophthora fragariae TaxID=53985 RepID=A0A6A3R5X6_9STRA|nr:hypothetical protein PF009_g20632 [Phytophthora fragariae]KAE9090113.1 hypothetical protein PF007_g19360 [Phytophthora fragariae]KAE9190579.1 hypothetical protein PF005_g19196 [Phytophthora fragariae]
MESGISEALVYSRAQLGHIAASNPYICARYFDRIVNTFIDVVLNWDTDNNCARREPGLFGCTKAFYAATESQNSTGSLHTHMLIWVDGMPSTVDDYYRMCSLDRFRATMVNMNNWTLHLRVTAVDGFSSHPVFGLITFIAPLRWKIWI